MRGGGWILTAGACAVLALAGGCGGAAEQTPGDTVRQVANGPLATADAGPTVKGAAARRARVPILMYHVIADAPPGAAYPGLWVPKRAFAEQMYVLREAGYRAVTMQQVLDAWTTGAELPAKPLVVSFDDGNRTQVEGAGPMLKALGWPGVLSLELNNLGSKGIKVSAVRALIDAGWEIGSHTVSHPDLTKVSDAQLRAELEDSRAQIAERFGLDATIFCYPAGKYDAHVEAAVRAAGYAAALAEGSGAASPTDDRYALPRIRVDASESAATLLAVVDGATAG
jgi:peptidoglycan/xylan/chitin deacetylase (PgdA/CDA1 family)